MKFLKPTLIFAMLLTLVAPRSIWAQDPHFSQYYNTPLVLNPALTGLFLEDVRVGIQYRNQWSTVTVPYKTFGAAVDFSAFKGSLGDDYVGFGFMMMNDVAGDARFRNTQAQFSFAYAKALSGMADQYLSAGAQFGMGQRGIDAQALTFDSQFDGAILNTNIASGEVIDRQQFSYADLSAGLAWYYTPDDRSSYYLGASMAHLNSPNISFYTDHEDRLHRRLTLHAGLQIPISQSIAILPTMIAVRQGAYRETNIGALLKFEVHPDYSENAGQTAFFIGSISRLNDAQIAIARFDYNNLSISASYDINTSELADVSRGNGGMELGITYHLWLYGTPRTSGPTGCPAW